MHRSGLYTMCASAASALLLDLAHKGPLESFHSLSLVGFRLLMLQVVLRNAGHMVPRDQPEAARYMIETWVKAALEYEPAQQQRSRAADGGALAFEKRCCGCCSKQHAMLTQESEVREQLV